MGRHGCCEYVGGLDGGLGGERKMRLEVGVLAIMVGS